MNEKKNGLIILYISLKIKLTAIPNKNLELKIELLAKVQNLQAPKRINRQFFSLI